MVYVQNCNGQPLMPTRRHGKVRYLLKEGKAKVIKRCPFTIQLTYETTNYTQDMTLGIDSGSKHIGLSVTSEKTEYYAGEVELRNDIVDLISTRRELRRSRRNRKTRYREPRFHNRKRCDSWVADRVTGTERFLFKRKEDCRITQRDDDTHSSPTYRGRGILRYYG